MRPESSYFITPAEFLDAKHRSVKGQRFMVESICGFYNQTIRVTVDSTAGQVTNELSQQSTFARTRQPKTENVILLIGGCQNILRFVADYEMPTLCRLRGSIRNQGNRLKLQTTHLANVWSASTETAIQGIPYAWWHCLYSRWYITKGISYLFK